MNISQFLQNSAEKFIEELLVLDRIEAKRVQAQGCPECGGNLDRSDYERHPRGLGILQSQKWRRISLCCRDCRKRTTPSSAIFLGRKVYIGLVVVLLSHLRGKANPELLSKVASLGCMSEVTIRRWLKWWKEPVLSSSFWKDKKSLFSMPVNELYFPSTLYEYFRRASSTIQTCLHNLLKFLRPLTLPPEYPC